MDYGSVFFLLLLSWLNRLHVAGRDEDILLLTLFMSVLAVEVLLFLLPTSKQEKSQMLLWKAKPEVYSKRDLCDFPMLATLGTGLESSVCKAMAQDNFDKDASFAYKVCEHVRVESQEYKVPYKGNYKLITVTISAYVDNVQVNENNKSQVVLVLKVHGAFLIIRMLYELFMLGKTIHALNQHTVVLFGIILFVCTIYNKASTSYGTLLFGVVEACVVYNLLSPGCFVSVFGNTLILPHVVLAGYAFAVCTGLMPDTHFLLRLLAMHDGHTGVILIFVVSFCFYWTMGYYQKIMLDTMLDTVQDSRAWNCILFFWNIKEYCIGFFCTVVCGVIVWMKCSLTSLSHMVCLCSSVVRVWQYIGLK